MKNLQNEERFVQSLLNEMKSVVESDSDIETKQLLIDDIYVKKIMKWSFSDEHLRRLNYCYDIAIGLLLERKYKDAVQSKNI